MSDWLISYGSWALAPFGLLGMYVVGLKKRWGWVLSMCTQALWATYAIGTAQYGFLIGTASYFAVYLKNWLGWRHPGPEADLVTELLRELDRLEQEKVRDGNAEQPWWYMRDTFASAAGIVFETVPEEVEGA